MGVYLLTSLIFIVAGFIEFAFILLLHQHNENVVQRKKQLSTWKEYWNGSTNPNHVYDSVIENGTANSLIPVFNTRKIDVAGFFVFGVLYLLFNVAYWSIYLFGTVD